MLNAAAAPLADPMLDTLLDKYGAPGEACWEDVAERVAKALAKLDGGPAKARRAREREFLWALLEGGARPGGRILANMGRDGRNASAINCTVSRTVEDSMAGIARAVGEAMETLAKGCGIGYCFSTLRPRGALVAGVGAATGGVLPFMDTFDAACATVSSAGGRRGAQMGTLDVRHPDVEDYIEAKARAGRLTNFNLSVLVGDEFMAAVAADGEHRLMYPVRAGEPRPPEGESAWARWQRPGPDAEYERDAEGRYLCRIHKRLPARDLWDRIMRLTYDSAEPGVLFIDRINAMNPLRSVEEIWATNPCGEQPLPPHGACLLGAIRLTDHVTDGLTEGAAFDWEGFARAARTFSRMLDNVVEDARLPLPEQDAELRAKRRHGMGIMGLGSALNLLGLRYGSDPAQAFARRVGAVLAEQSWREAVALAREKGRAPVFEDPAVLEAHLASPYVSRLVDEGVLDGDWRAAAAEHGLRWSHATTVAPTGTTAFVSGNCSNGIEPTFAHRTERNILVAAGEAKRTVLVRSLEEAYAERHGLPRGPAWTAADDVSPAEHVAMQAAVQRFVDSSISKTVNVPEDMPFQAFKDVYRLAYEQGLKGCATYRPTPQRAGVLTREGEMARRRYRFRTADGAWREFGGGESVSHDRREPTRAALLHEALNQGQYAPRPAPEGAAWPDGAGRIEGELVEWAVAGPAQAPAAADAPALPPELAAEADAAAAVEARPRSEPELPELIDEIRRGATQSAKTRPLALPSMTYRLHVNVPDAMPIYVHVSKLGDRLHEVFINSKDTQHAAWQASFSLTLSALLRRIDGLAEIADLISDLKSVRDADGGALGRSVDGGHRYVPSIISEVGYALERAAEDLLGKPISARPAAAPVPGACPACGGELRREEGCQVCGGCGYSKCG